MTTYANCFDVSGSCPVTESVLGYTPSLAANATLLALFSLVAVVHLIRGAAWKTYGFMIAFFVGSIIEIAGR